MFPDLPTLCGCYKIKHWFLCRELFHVLGGLVASSFGQVAMFSSHPTLIRIKWAVIVLIIIICKEILEDGVSQNRFKTYWDVVSWAIGLGIGSYLFSLL